MKHRNLTNLMGTAVNKLLKGLVLVAIALSSCVIYPMIALAQEQERASIVDTFLEEIIVTARKREESLQDTPMSVSAFTGESLELRGIDAIDKLQNVTPNLTFLNSSPFIAGGNAATMFVRGVGQPDFQPTTEPGVGIYVDGVYYGRTVGSVLSLVDFERVEVLRGPQGTLFGRNTIGGAISITTKKPTDERQAALSTPHLRWRKSKIASASWMRFLRRSSSPPGSARSVFRIRQCRYPHSPVNH